MEKQEVAIRKRSQIAKANRTMFAWIAVASALVGFALVVSIFLVQKLLFNERVLGEKETTITTLRANNAIISELEAQVRVLDTNTALAAAKAKPTDQALQVILDALPSDANFSALGASLQSRLLKDIPGLTLQSMQVDPVLGVEQLTGDASVQDASGTVAGGQITFNFVVSGNQTALKQALTNLERSIRTIDILSLTIESQGKVQVMSVKARAFYEPARVVQLYDKVVKS